MTTVIKNLSLGTYPKDKFLIHSVINCDFPVSIVKIIAYIKCQAMDDWSCRISHPIMYMKGGE
jgi:hypothetical protein